MIRRYLKDLARVRSFNDLFKLVFAIMQNKKIRFLVVGGFNTLICYIFGLIYFKLVTIDVVKITIFNIITIINSYLMHKFFSFRKRNRSFSEITRAIISYGSIYVISVFLITALVKLGYSQLMAYHINLIISISLLYFIHTRFTFK